jgi:hypothetical protein
MKYRPYNETPTEGTALINLKTFKSEPTDLEKEIARLFAEMAQLPSDGEEYDRVSNQIKKLYPLKETDSKKGVSGDVLVGAASNLVGILLIINHEYLHALNSKALNFVGKKF